MSAPLVPTLSPGTLVVPGRVLTRLLVTTYHLSDAATQSSIVTTTVPLWIAADASTVQRVEGPGSRGRKVVGRFVPLEAEVLAVWPLVSVHTTFHEK